MRWEEDDTDFMTNDFDLWQFSCSYMHIWLFHIVMLRSFAVIFVVVCTVLNLP
jgi:hypothetical protein